ncbi:substrate-binding periplasmic protein [Aquabacterium humicola]|uniref:substrate-binding periplasmic protein n=1 Tax=Aquabacterium humicola TaxID=3237377 RepID=UPI002542AA9E|nr:transporter substrate-binding domain-containing protein [Rubrivivax pictus]
MIRRRVLVALVALGAGLGHGAATAQPLVIGTHAQEDTVQGRLVRNIHREAFRRIGVEVRVDVFPLQRLTMLSRSGEIDGDVARVHGYGAAHPDLVRVEEPMYALQFGLFAVKEGLQVRQLQELAGQPWRVVYLRGVALCRDGLEATLKPAQIQALNDEDQGLDMLLADRADLYCASDAVLEDRLSRPRYRDAPKFRLQVPLGPPLPLYAYLHRRHAELAPRLAAALRQMKAEGLIDRYRQESLLHQTAR